MRRLPESWPLLALGAVLFVAGSIASAIGVHAWQQDNALIDSAPRVKASVTQRTQHGGGKAGPDRIEVQFFTPDRSPHWAWLEVASTSSYFPGGHAEIAYDPDDPSHAVFPTGASPSNALLYGPLFLLGGVVTFFFGVTRRSPNKDRDAED